MGKRKSSAKPPPKKVRHLLPVQLHAWLHMVGMVAKLCDIQKHWYTTMLGIWHQLHPLACVQRCIMQQRS
jgi:hypothetical protein